MKREKYILALVGSQRADGNTRYLCEHFLEAVSEEWKGTGCVIRSEILTADGWDFNSCISCSSCFREGFCPLDEQDGMKELKDKIMRADSLIFASPVYAAAVSGDMKRLIDRLSGWLHTMPLIGKTAAVLSTADSNSGDTAISYMRWVLEDMGAIVTVEWNVFVHYGAVILRNENILKPLLHEQARKFLPKTEEIKKPSKAQEEHYKRLAVRYEKMKKLGEEYLGKRFAEERIWDEQGYSACQSMSEALSVMANVGKERGNKNEGMV